VTRLGWVAAAASLLAAGCAMVDPGAGVARVDATVRQHAGSGVSWARDEQAAQHIDEQVAALLARPLAADDAVRLALLNHRGLQARLADLGIGEADLVQAGRLPNPGFGFARSSAGGEVEIERSLHFNLARLLLLPMAVRLEQRRLAQTEREVAADLLAHAAETRRAWVRAVSAAESVRYMRQVMEAAEASAELARRMEQVGNFNKLMRAREQGFYAEAALGLARAELAERSAREKLTRLLGLWGERTRFRLPDRLPDLPAEPADEPDIERRAIAQRLDVAAARLAVQASAENLGLTQATRWVDVFEFGLTRESAHGEPRRRGWEIGFQLPIFDSGDARAARAEAMHLQAVQRAAMTAVDARSQVREAYALMRGAYEIARHHRDEIVPLRKRIADEQLLRYNGMLIGVFELLADARAQVAAVAGAIDALRDFWLARADLDAALIGPVSPAPPAAQAAPAAAGGSGGH